MTGADELPPQVREALGAYGLAQATASAVPAGMVNACYRVDSADAAMLLKWYRPATVEAFPQALPFVYVTQEDLRAQGLPIPAVVRTPAGAHILETDSGFFTLSEFVRGRQFPRGQMPPACAFAMGATLARLHAALARLPMGQPRVLPTVDAESQRIENLLRLAQARKDQAAVDRLAVSVLKSKLRRLEAWNEPLPQVMPQWTHGDYQDTNVIFSDGGEVAAVVDWDVMGVTSREYEVMRAYNFSFPDGAQGGFEFLEGYLRTSGMSTADVKALVPLWDYTRTVRTWPIEARYEHPGSYQARWDVFISEPSGWWEANREHLQEALLELAGLNAPGASGRPLAQLP